MDQNKLTQKSQEALNAAQNKAVTFGHQEVGTEHLLVALLEQTDGLVPGLFRKMDVPPDSVVRALEDELRQRPSMTGPGYEAGKIYLSQPLSKALVEAEKHAERMKDAYVSVEHLVMAILGAGSSTPTSQILHKFNVDSDRFLHALLLI